jgi:hypothetical protein
MINRVAKVCRAPDALAICVSLRMSAQGTGLADPARSKTGRNRCRVGISAPRIGHKSAEDLDLDPMTTIVRPGMLKSMVLRRGSIRSVSIKTPQQAVSTNDATRSVTA